MDLHISILCCSRASNTGHLCSQPFCSIGDPLGKERRSHQLALYLPSVECVHKMLGSTQHLAHVLGLHSLIHSTAAAPDVTTEAVSALPSWVSCVMLAFASLLWSSVEGSILCRLPDHPRVPGFNTKRPVFQEILHSWATWTGYSLAELFVHWLNLPSDSASENLHPSLPCPAVSSLSDSLLSSFYRSMWGGSSHWTVHQSPAVSWKNEAGSCEVQCNGSCSFC